MLVWDIPYTAETLRFYAEFCDKYGGEVAATSSSQLGMMLSEPYGVICAITPWNFPLSMAGWKLGPALAAGNAVVIKPSEMTPFSTVFLAELATAAGMPDGILNVVLGEGPTTGALLTRHPDINKISFTGSTAAGAKIMAASASSGIKPVTLELGGKSPQIVFADADLSLAAKCISGSILSNAGQACVAGTRAIVHRNVKEELCDLICTHMANISVGDTWDEKTGYSPIISAEQLTRIDSILSQTREQGGDVIIGGRKIDRSGFFYEPTIITNVAQESVAVQQEIFGPVLTLQTFADEEEAVVMAEHREYGLAAGIYTQNLSLAMRMSRQLDVGTVWVNRYGRSNDFIIPTGGFKGSGIGKDLGCAAFEASLRTKNVLIDI